VIAASSHLPAMQRGAVESPGEDRPTTGKTQVIRRSLLEVRTGDRPGCVSERFTANLLEKVSDGQLDRGGGAPSSHVADR